jgi:hypothetical protein
MRVGHARHHTTRQKDQRRNAGRFGRGIRRGGCPAKILGAITAIHRRDVEGDGSPPLFAARACPGVLRAFSDAEDRARLASPEYSGSKLPHST